MTRKVSAFSLPLIAMMLVASFVGQAQAQSFMTGHAREVTVPSVGRLPAAQVLRLVITLPLRHQPELESFLEELYDPSSPSYRHFLTVEDSPRAARNYDAVIHFAEANGRTVVGTSRNRVNIDVMGSVANIEKAFHIALSLYQHPVENRTFYAPDREPTTDLGIPLWPVTGLDNYSVPRPQNRAGPRKTLRFLSLASHRSLFCAPQEYAARDYNLVGLFSLGQAGKA